MKLLSFVLTSFIAATATAATRTDVPEGSCDKPVPWEQVPNQNAVHWAFYSEAAGTNLANAQPKYHECTANNEAGKEKVFRTFAGNKDFEFQQLSDGVLAANCINCSPPQLGNYYLTQITAYIGCKKYEDRGI